jgi:hypothetical protein
VHTQPQSDQARGRRLRAAFSQFCTEAYTLSRNTADCEGMDSSLLPLSVLQSVLLRRSAERVGMFPSEQAEVLTSMRADLALLRQPPVPCAPPGARGGAGAARGEQECELIADHYPPPPLAGGVGGPGHGAAGRVTHAHIRSYFDATLLHTSAKPFRATDLSVCIVICYC